MVKENRKTLAEEYFKSKLVFTQCCLGEKLGGNVEARVRVPCVKGWADHPTLPLLHPTEHSYGFWFYERKNG